MEPNRIKSTTLVFSRAIVKRQKGAITTNNLKALVAGVVLLGTACASPALTSTSMPESDVVQGKHFYQAECAACHGQDARGTEKAPSLHGLSDARILEAVRQEHCCQPQSRPAYLLTDEEVAKITAFIRSLE